MITVFSVVLVFNMSYRAGKTCIDFFLPMPDLLYAKVSLYLFAHANTYIKNNGR